MELSLQVPGPCSCGTDVGCNVLKGNIRRLKRCVRSFNTVGPQYQDLPSVLAETKYENLSDNTQTVFNKTFKTSLPVFLWFLQHPEAFNHFNKYMGAQRVGMPTWLDVYPVKDETSTWAPQKPVFVDVGGGFGHQCAALQAQYPDLRGQIILQDLPQALAHAMPLPNVKIMEHDFFQPQPVKGLCWVVHFYLHLLTICRREVLLPS